MKTCPVCGHKLRTRAEINAELDKEIAAFVKLSFEPQVNLEQALAVCKRIQKLYEERLAL